MGRDRTFERASTTSTTAAALGALAVFHAVLAVISIAAAPILWLGQERQEAVYVACGVVPLLALTAVLAGLRKLVVCALEQRERSERTLAVVEALRRSTASREDAGNAR